MNRLAIAILGVLEKIDSWSLRKCKFMGGY